MSTLSAVRKWLAGFSSNYWIIVVTFSIFHFSFRGSWTYYYNYIVALGATEAIVGVVSAINSIAFAISQIPGGYLADTIGRKRLVVSMTWLIAFINFMVACAPSWETLLLISIIDGIVRAYIPALRALLQDSLSNDVRARGLMLSTALPTIISVPAPWIAGYIISMFSDPILGYRTVFLMAFVFSIVAAILRLKLRETLEKLALKKIDLRLICKYIINAFNHIRITWRELTLATKQALLAMVVLTLAQGMYMPYLIRIATARALFSDAEWGIIMSISLVISTMLSFSIMPIADRISRRCLVLLGSIIMSVGLLIFYNYTSLLTLHMVSQLLFRDISFLGLIVGLSMVFAGFSLISGGYGSFIAETTRLELRGELMALDNLISTMGIAIGSFIASLIYICIYETMLIICAMLVIAFGTLSQIIMRIKKLN
ncbi:MAG: hypothetical protein DRO15_02295 [Thermoprotei archaeon]|nr:MAG: hypothetical protein DRO15_02295 [Thermoprotei archaeon]